MKDLKIEEYKLSHMTVEKDIVSWEGHAIRASGIARIWTAGIPQKPFSFNMALILLMIALSSSRVLNLTVMLVILAAYMLAHLISLKLKTKTNRRNHVNMELYNGKIYSFAAGNEAFAGELYETLKNLLAAKSSGLHYEILFEDGGKIIDQLEKAETEETARISEIENAELQSDSQITKELKKLYKHYQEKKDFSNETLALIDEARALTAKNDKEGLKAVFAKFVTSGLINDCNELGMDCLLQEIKSIFN